MKDKLFFILVVILAAMLMLGAKFSSDVHTGRGWPQVINAAPSAPYTCDANHVGDIIYVDDTNDGDEADLCFCATDADDSTYIWIQAQATATACF